MNLYLRKGLFLFLLACLQILLVFFSSTGFEIILISIFILFLTFYFWFFKLSVICEYKIGLIWIGLIVSLIISSIYTHSIPLSLESIVFFLASFCIFVFFRSLNSREIFLKSEFALVFLLIGFVLSLFFILFFSFPNLSLFLPQINLLTIEYGHSHFAALLLFLIPLGWWFSISKEYSMFRFRKSILVLFYVILIFTFGRFAIVLCLAQIPFLLKISGEKQIKKIHLLILSFIALFLFIAIVFISFNTNEKCIFQNRYFPICKPIFNDSRPEYFKQAILAFKDRPLVGYGPGTFSLISKRYSEVTYFGTIYAHNIFLHILSESGIFTGLFFLTLIILIYKNIFLLLKNDINNFSVDSYFFVGMVSLLINSLLDFDWNLFATFQVSVIIIAIMNWNSQNDRLITQSKQIDTDIFIKFFLLFSIIVLFVLGSNNVLTKILIANNKYELAFNTFPYFYFQSEIYLKKNEISVAQRKVLYRIYSNHSEFIHDQINQTNDAEIKKELYLKLIEVDPLIILDKNYYEFLKEVGDSQGLIDVIQKGLQLLDNYEMRGVVQQYMKREDILLYLHELAINGINSGNPAIAVTYYDKILPIFYDIKNYREYDLRYNAFFSKNSYWSSRVNEYLQILLRYDQNLAKEELLKIERLCDTSNSYGFNKEPFIGANLADLSVNIGINDLVNNNASEAAKMYILAHKMDDQIFNRISIKFLDLLKSDRSRSEFWSEIDIIPDESYRIYSEQISKEYLHLFFNAMEKKDADLTVQRFEKVIKIAPWTISNFESSELASMQELANYFVEQNDWDSTLKIVKLMYKTNTYYGKMQLGNYYLLKDEKELSLKAYSLCSQEWFEQKGIEHKDCAMLIDGYDKANKDTYWQVSQQILIK